MPISNLAIQRRRLNELKALGYKNPEPYTFDSYTKFIILMESFTTQHAKVLNEVGFYVEEIQAAKSGMIGIVTKNAIERTQPIKYKVKEIQN